METNTREKRYNSVDMSLLFRTSGRVGLERDAIRVDVHVVLFDVDVESDVLVLQISEYCLTQILQDTEVLECLVNLLLQLLLDALQYLFLLSYQQTRQFKPWFKQLTTHAAKHGNNCYANYYWLCSSHVAQHG